MSDQVEQFRQAQRQLCDAAYQQYKSHSYSAGYFQSMAWQMFAQMTARQKAEFLRQMELDAERLKTLAQLLA